MKLSIRSTTARSHGTSNSTQSGRADTTSIAGRHRGLGQHLVQELDERLWLDGLRHVPPRLFADRPEQRFRRVVRGHHDDSRARPFLGQRGQHVQPVHLRHPHIEEHQIVGAGAQAFQGVHAVLRRRDRESGGLQRFRQELTRRPVIFDD